MKINPNYIINATKLVLNKRKYFLALIILIFAIFAVFISVPVFTIPANSFLFQLKAFAIRDYALIIILSTLMSLLIVMQVFSFNQAKLFSPGKTTVSGGSAIIASIFGTASCLSCLAAVFGFLGLSIGAVLFLVEYRWLIVGIAIVIMLISLYFTSLKINGVCEECRN